MTVRRFDRVAIKADEKRTPQGFLRVPARIARTGIQAYAQPDGTVRREFRPPDEVFHDDALASFSLSPLTLLHPEVPVTSENAAQLSVGTVGEVVKRDGRFVSATVIVHDAKAIEKVLAGTQELSCGYECDLDLTPGEVDGQRYDAIQRSIRGNHVAIVPQGRAGPEVRMKLDATDAVAVEDPPAQTQEKKMVKIVIDGVEVEMSETAAQLVKRAQAQHEEARKSLEQAKKDAETAKARADVAEAAKTTAEKARKDAEDPARIEALVAERVTLISQAQKVLGQEFKADGKSPAEIRKAMLAKLVPALKLDGKSDDYVAAALDAQLAAQAEKNPADKARKTQNDSVTVGTLHADDEIDEAEARERMKKTHRDAWKSDEQKKLEREAAAE
jgi:hypothetical protein